MTLFVYNKKDEEAKLIMERANTKEHVGLQRQLLQVIVFTKNLIKCLLARVIRIMNYLFRLNQA